jgi:hypothetical protein
VAKISGSQDFPADFAAEDRPMSAWQSGTGEWQQLRLALEAAGGKAWRENAKREIRLQAGSRIVFANGATAWRFASESKLHHGKESTR